MLPFKHTLDDIGGTRPSNLGGLDQRRGSKGAEIKSQYASMGWPMGRGYSPPQPTRGSGGVSWAPPGVQGRAPAKNAFDTWKDNQCFHKTLAYIGLKL